MPAFCDLKGERRYWLSNACNYLISCFFFIVTWQYLLHQAQTKYRRTLGSFIRVRIFSRSLLVFRIRGERGGGFTRSLHVYSASHVVSAFLYTRCQIFFYIGTE